MEPMETIQASFDYQMREKLRTLRAKLIKIVAKAVRHSRYVIFQMAEVAVPQTLFREILG